MLPVLISLSTDHTNDVAKFIKRYKDTVNALRKGNYSPASNNTFSSTGGLCHYDSSSFSAKLTRDQLRRHYLIIIGTRSTITHSSIADDTGIVSDSMMHKKPKLISPTEYFVEDSPFKGNFTIHKSIRLDKIL